MYKIFILFKNNDDVGSGVDSRMIIIVLKLNDVFI
jgi:hypothetical protein